MQGLALLALAAQSALVAAQNGLAKVNIPDLKPAHLPKYLYRVETRPPVNDIFVTGIMAVSQDGNLGRHMAAASNNATVDIARTQLLLFGGSYTSLTADEDFAMQLADMLVRGAGKLTRKVAYIYRVTPNSNYFSLTHATKQYLKDAENSHQHTAYAQVVARLLPFHFVADEWIISSGVPGRDILDVMEVRATDDRMALRHYVHSKTNPGYQAPTTKASATGLRPFFLGTDRAVELHVGDGELVPAFVGLTWAMCWSNNATDANPTAVLPFVDHKGRHMQECVLRNTTAYRSKRWKSRGVAALRSPVEREAYFFKRDKYLRLRFDNNVNSLVSAVGDLSSVPTDWKGLRDLGFDEVDAFLPYPNDPKKAYVFSGNEYGIIKLGNTPQDSRLVVGPRLTSKYWPGLAAHGFDHGVDAIVAHTTNNSEAFFFKADAYVAVSVNGDQVGGELLEGPLPIDRFSHALIPAKMVRDIITALPHQTQPDQVYFFGQTTTALIALDTDCNIEFSASNIMQFILHVDYVNGTWGTLEYHGIYPW